MSAPTQHISVRLPSDLVERITAHAAERSMTRSDAIGNLIEQGLKTIGDAVSRCPTVSHSELVERLEALEQAMTELRTAKVRTTKVSQCDTGLLGKEIPGDPGFVFGTLCYNRHDYMGTGFTRRSAKHGRCYICEHEKAEKRKAERAAKSA